MYPSQSVAGVFPPMVIPNMVQSLTKHTTTGGTLTLTNGSDAQHYFTGSLTHTIVLPVVSTLILGQQFDLKNGSTQPISVLSSGMNSITTIAPDNSVVLTCISLTGTDETSWFFETIFLSSPGAIGLGDSSLFTLGSIAVVAEASLTISAGNPYVFSTPIQNVGNHYNTTTGRFTVPANGYYSFHLGSETGNGLSVTLQFSGNLDPAGLNQIVPLKTRTDTPSVSISNVFFCEANQVFFWECLTNPVTGGYQNMRISSLF